MGAHGVKAVFFDLDNTLVDTAAAGRRAIEEVLPVSPPGPAAARLPLPSPPAAVPPDRHRRAAGGPSGAVRGGGGRGAAPGSVPVAP